MKVQGSNWERACRILVALEDVKTPKLQTFVVKLAVYIVNSVEKGPICEESREPCTPTKTTTMWPLTHSMVRTAKWVTKVVKMNYIPFPASALGYKHSFLFVDKMLKLV